ncbi:MAG TPA: class I SAM-dependent methyltransferase [Alphaproteobacteria bacterium]|jgi:SAM-dependent methyltransferase
MATDHKPRHGHDDHDWHADDYVQEWYDKNEKREERGDMLRALIAANAPYPKDAPLRVMDVGGGYGFVTGELLKIFPRAEVTLQDYSQPMLDRARDHLKAHAGQIHYALSDLTDPTWAKKAVAEAGGKPFDLVVSSIAIHNLRDHGKIGAVYKAVKDVLVPGGWFLNADHFVHSGGNDAHIKMMQDAGYKHVALVDDEGHSPLMKGQA